MARELSPIIIDNNEETHTGIKAKLEKLNVPCDLDDLPIDFMWYSDGVPIMGDRKTVEDFIASHGDGRLHAQCTAIKDADAWGFILIEGSTYPRIIGHRRYGWPHDVFDNALGDVQDEGIVVYHAREGEVHTRIAHLYEHTASDKRSWHNPTSRVPIVQSRFIDKRADQDYRRRVGMIMATNGVGAEKAADLLENRNLQLVLGITEEGLFEAKKIWLSVKGIGKTLFDNYERMINER